MTGKFRSSHFTWRTAQYRTYEAIFNLWMTDKSRSCQFTEITLEGPLINRNEEIYNPWTTGKDVKISKKSESELILEGPVTGELGWDIHHLSVGRGGTEEEAIESGGQRRQVTRGRNIIADGWAGVCNPHLHPRPPHSHTEYSFSHFLTWSSQTDGLTQGRMDRRTDKASHRLRFCN